MVPRVPSAISPSYLSGLNHQKSQTMVGGGSSRKLETHAGAIAAQREEEGAKSVGVSGVPHSPPAGRDRVAPGGGAGAGSPSRPVGFAAPPLKISRLLRIRGDLLRLVLLICVHTGKSTEYTPNLVGFKTVLRSCLVGKYTGSPGPILLHPRSGGPSDSGVNLKGLAVDTYQLLI